MFLSKIEYVLLRLIRRYLFSNNFLERFGAVVPYYLKNCNSFNPQSVINRYELYARQNGFPLAGKVVLELGPGVTNSTAYELSVNGCAQVYAYEPYAQFDKKTDEKLLLSISKRSGTERNEIFGNVKRVASVDNVPENSIDLILSHSVLEHVVDPVSLFKALYGKLKNNGMMMHSVDYRDHFFKYPYHKLLFSKDTWKQWLNPGDLPGWLLKDHLDMFDKAGFKAWVDNVSEDPINFEKIKNFISKDYDRNDPLLATTLCSIAVSKKTEQRNGFGSN